MAVVQAIKEWIAKGELSSGAAVPSERVLSERLHVQRPTIRRALAILEEEGLIRTLSPRTKVVTQRKRSMANSIVVAAVPQPDNRDKRRSAPWATKMVESVVEAIAQRRYNLVLIHPDRATAQDIEQLASGSPSGVVVPEISSDISAQLQWSRTLERVGIPMVVYGGNPELADLDRVTSDHEHGSYELTRLLMERGCRRILMLFQTQRDAYWVQGRRRGYERALAEAGVAALPLVMFQKERVLASDDRAEVFESARRRAASYLLEYVGLQAGANAVDAIMTASDGETFAVAAACRLLGVVPGKDVLIVGYDNYWRECWERDLELATPLATVDKHNAGIGEELVSLLVDRIEGRLPPQPQTRVVPPQLVIEGNTKGDIPQ